MSQADNLIPDFEDTEFDDREEKEKPKPRKKMKIEKDDDEWRIQYNKKPNADDLLNIRGRTWEEFEEVARACMEHNEFLAILASTLDFRPELPLAPVAPPALVQQTIPQGSIQQGVQVPEVGPLTVTGIQPGMTPPAGPNSKSPGKTFKKWIVEFGNGAILAETLNENYANVATNLLGKNAYARVEKTKWGYKLLTVRPAA